MKWLDLGSMGELTAVASAKRAVRGDLSDGGLRDDRVATESSDDARGRAAILIDSCFFSMSDMTVRTCFRGCPNVSRL